MTNNTDVLLNWLKTFQTSWLPERIPNDTELIQSIKTKLCEFEQLITDTHEHDEEYHRAKLLNDNSSSNSESEQIPIASTSAHDVSPDNRLNVLHQSHNDDEEEERARQMLLEQSDASDNLDDDDEDMGLFRPSILLKRISQADAERYMPMAWRNVQENPSNDKKKTSSSSSSSSSSDDDDEEFHIKTRRRGSISKKKEKSPVKSNKHSNNNTTNNNHSHKKTKDIVITYNSATTVEQSPINDALTNDEDITPMDDDRILQDVIDNNDNDSVFESLNITHDKPVETNENNQMEESSNEQIEPSPNDQESSDERPPIEVPSYAHLLNHSKSSSDTDSSSKKSPSKTENKSKHSLTSSPQSNSTKNKQKTKKFIRRRISLSSISLSSDENENNKTLTPRNNISPKSQQKSPPSASRIRIQRSSSSSSENSHGSKTTPSRRQRKKRVSSDERSTILKEIKRKTQERKHSESSTTSDDSSDHQSKRKKSKLNDDDDDDNDDNEEEGSQSKQKHGRKNIRKILDDKELDIQTKDAIEAERERRKRIAEKQKEYNDSLLEQSSDISINQPTTTTTTTTDTNTRLILELDKTTNEPIVEVSSKLVEQLKPHQCDGIRFLWNNVFESIDAIKNKKNHGNGCILAHCMGLGKTLQVISFIHTAFNYSNITNIKTCLVLCPINAALNWSNEFEYWLHDVEPSIDHYQLTTIKRDLRVCHINYWYKNGGVMIMGYELYRRLVNGTGLKSKQSKADVYRCLVDPGPDIIVADEGHILKNAQTALAKCLSKIKTTRRIVLTGTPLQNNLIEYYCMVSFIKPSLLGSQSEYINRFVNPIQNGQHRDSNEEDVRLMKRRACVLHELLSGFVDRKDYSLLQNYLPPKYEYIVNIRLSDLQTKLYQTYLEQLVNKEQRLSIYQKNFQSAKLFADYHYLQKIWTHPFLLYPHFIDRWKKQLNKDDENFVDDNDLEELFIDDDDDNVGRKKNNAKNKGKNVELENIYSGFLIDNVKDEAAGGSSTVSKSKKRRPSNSSTTTTLDSDVPEGNDNVNGANDSNSKETDDDDDIEIIKTYATRSRTMTNDKNDTSSDNIQENNSDEPWLDDMREQFWYPFLDMLPEDSQFDVELAGKFLLFKYILDKCEEIGDKIILYSRSIYTLNYIEKFLHYLHIQNEKSYLSQKELGALLSTDNEPEPIPEPIKWIRDRDYFRMDGQTDVTVRKRYAKAFNDMSNIRARLFLISTLAGGIGINLVGGNRVIVFDASWNPSHDAQAIFRSYRFGQKKPVYIYRFLAHGTMEHKIYQRQVVKQSTSQRVVDDHQLDRHFTQNDVKEFYKFQPEPLPEGQTTALDFNYAIPKDHLLLDLLYEHNRWIHSYHSHDSLLENKVDESLSAEERRRALEEYENLKRLPDPRQMAYQNVQQQQRLNQLIAQQQQMALNAARYQQISPELLQTFRDINRQNPDYPQLLRQVQALRILTERANNNNNNHRTTAGPINIAPRPPPPTTTTTNAVILVDSDEEMNGNGDTVPE